MLKRNKNIVCQSKNSYRSPNIFSIRCCAVKKIWNEAMTSRYEGTLYHRDENPASPMLIYASRVKTPSHWTASTQGNIKSRARSSSLNGVAKTAEESASSTLSALVRARGILSASAWTSSGPVSSATSSNMPHCSILHCVSCSLTFEFFIEWEDSTLGRLVNVACSTATRAEFRLALGDIVAKKRCWSTSCWSVCGLGGFECIACSSSSRVNVGAGCWVRLGDLVARHNCWEGWMFLVREER